MVEEIAERIFGVSKDKYKKHLERLPENPKSPGECWRMIGKSFNNRDRENWNEFKIELEKYGLIKVEGRLTYRNF